MKVIVIKDNGSKVEFNNILNWAVIEKETVQNIAIDQGEQLTEDELKEFAERVDRKDDFPSYSEMIEIVTDILEER